MLARVITAAVIGIQAEPITVEADIANGLPRTFIVGLPDKAVSEAQERVRSAMSNSPGISFPLQRITINLAPADVRKEGSGFDVAIAIAICAARNFCPVPSDDICILGELGLQGQIRSTTGVLAIIASLKEKNIKRFIVPEENAAEATLVSGVEIFPAATLNDVILHVREKKKLLKATPQIEHKTTNVSAPDLADISGQDQAKRCLEIAAAGGHNVLLSGPPGSGKTLLARAFAGMLPPLTESEALEVTRIYSVAGLLRTDRPFLRSRPFRSPHHTASPAAIVGGGSSPRPGEITLAHRGVLFLDEFPEFPRTVLESLRQPLEDGEVTVSRAATSVTFPARGILIASQNPCPCGYYEDVSQRCRCTPIQLERYRRKISGPLLDRIDLFCSVPRLQPIELEQRISRHSTTEVRLRIDSARKQQSRRFVNTTSIVNADMDIRAIHRFCQLDDKANELLRTASTALQLSGRAYHRVLRVSRTIADLDQQENICSNHVAEALQFRQRM